MPEESRPVSMTRDKEGLLTVCDAEASQICWVTCDQRRPPSSSPFLARSRLLVFCLRFWRCVAPHRANRLCAAGPSASGSKEGNLTSGGTSHGEQVRSPQDVHLRPVASARRQLIVHACAVSART